MTRWFWASVPVLVALALLQPRAAALVLLVGAPASLVFPRVVVLGVCVAMMVGAQAGLRVDAVTPSAVPVRGSR